MLYEIEDVFSWLSVPSSWAVTSPCNTKLVSWERPASVLQSVHEIEDWWERGIIPPLFVLGVKCAVGKLPCFPKSQTGRKTLFAADCKSQSRVRFSFRSFFPFEAPFLHDDSKFLKLFGFCGLRSSMGELQVGRAVASCSEIAESPPVEVSQRVTRQSPFFMHGSFTLCMLTCVFERFLLDPLDLYLYHSAFTVKIVECNSNLTIWTILIFGLLSYHCWGIKKRKPKVECWHLSITSQAWSLR